MSTSTFIETTIQSTQQQQEESALVKSLKISDNIQDITNFVISLIWLIIYIRSFQNHSQPIYKSTIIITSLYPFGLTLKYFIDIFDFFIIDTYYEHNSDVQWFKNIILDNIQFLCFVITNTVFYLSMLLKLKNAFKGSIYELNQYILYLFYILLSIAFLLNATYFTTRKVAELTGKIDEDISFHLNWIQLIFFIFLSIILMGCFVNKLLKFVMLSSRLRRQESVSTVTNIENMISYTSNSRNSRSMIIKEEKHNLSNQQRVHLVIAVKFVLLHGIAITLTNIQFSGWSLLNFELITNENSIIWFDIIWSWWWDVVLFINYYTIWLSFPFAKHHYNYVCNKCNKWCLNICSLLVATKMAEEIHKSSSINTIEICPKP